MVGGKLQTGLVGHQYWKGIIQTPRHGFLVDRPFALGALRSRLFPNSGGGGGLDLLFFREHRVVV